MAIIAAAENKSHAIYLLISVRFSSDIHVCYLTVHTLMKYSIPVLKKNFK